ncbi:MAG: HAD family hydrolase [Lachnospiraceae bacterium]|nr:HAD family hydrolase [Lachnospiraceae bacterium]
MYNTVLFDLDGTLTDSAPGIINSIRYALNKLNIEVNEKTLNNFIGPPLVKSFAKYYGMNEEESRNAVEIYREYFTDKGMFENSVYPGIEDSLKKLKDAGKRLLVCTAKPEVFAETILKHFNLDGYFDYIGGSLMDETRTSKSEVMRYLINLCELDVKHTVMVGDRADDVNAARGAHMDCIAVFYGYGSPVELTTAGAKFFCGNPASLADVILEFDTVK